MKKKHEHPLWVQRYMRVYEEEERQMSKMAELHAEEQERKLDTDISYQEGLRDGFKMGYEQALVDGYKDGWEQAYMDYQKERRQ